MRNLAVYPVTVQEVDEEFQILQGLVDVDLNIGSSTPYILSLVRRFLKEHEQEFTKFLEDNKF